MRNKNCAGLSIVEALVTMVILMITLGGVYQIFHSNSLTYRMQEGLARVQENGRFAMNFLVNDIRMAGYFGCFSGAPIGSFFPIEEADETSGTNVLTIRRALDKRADILGVSPQTNSTNIEISNNGYSFKSGEMLVLNNCAAIYFANAVTDSSNNTVLIDIVNIPENFMGEILNIAEISYHVGNGTSQVPSLFRHVPPNNPQEIVEGVEAIRFRFGIDTNNDRNVDTFEVAADVTDWSRVRSVQIALLAASHELIRGMEPDMTPFKFFEGTDDEEEIIISTENRRRFLRVFEATVGVRNRLQ
jgi:type IV pilus assembly protein PilW